MYFVGAVLQGTHPHRPKPGLFDSSGCALPNDVGASTRPLRPRMWPDRHPRQRSLPCCARWRDRRTLDNPRGRRPVPASAWRLRRLRPPSMVIVLRRLEVSATVKGREALPHGHSVADCPLLPPSRRLAQPGRSGGNKTRARAHSHRSLKKRHRPSPGTEIGRLLTRPYGTIGAGVSGFTTAKFPLRPRRK